uniref:Uncharacterized protein n=1 Tax=Anguilla anguilla TaxID=7936 RepID=A0A0E9TL67_ANGAN
MQKHDSFYTPRWSPNLGPYLLGMPQITIRGRKIMYCRMFSI